MGTTLFSGGTQDGDRKQPTEPSWEQTCRSASGRAQSSPPRRIGSAGVLMQYSPSLQIGDACHDVSRLAHLTSGVKEEWCFTTGASGDWAQASGGKSAAYVFPACRAVPGHKPVQKNSSQVNHTRFRETEVKIGLAGASVNRCDDQDSYCSELAFAAPVQYT